MEIKPGLVKWGLLAAGIVALEVTPGGTLTGYAHEIQKTIPGKVVAGVIGGITFAHLMRDIPLPRSIDPYYRIGDMFEYVKSKADG